MATKLEVERLSVLETKVDRAVSDISDIKTTVTTEFAGINSKIDNLDKKYAAKWVQSAVSFVIGIIVAAVLTALIALVIVPNLNNQPSGNSTTQTTTTTTPTGSSSTAKTTPTPSANANASAQSTPANPSSTDSQSSNGGLQVTLPKVN